MDLNELKNKVKETLDSTDLDEKALAAAKEMKDKLGDGGLDEKLKAGASVLREKAGSVDKDALMAQMKDLQGKVKETLDKTDLDEKLKEKLKGMRN